ncbi:hypothetical protein MPLSOD_270032 [Mesorhizobium sp. SOD10]|nr:hypothetical protein MPLSOD_270032 [Mesorhizobium sp. SOD10]
MNGLDPVAAWEVKRVITALCASGRHADIVSTHVVEAGRELMNEQWRAACCSSFVKELSASQSC